MRGWRKSRRTFARLAEVRRTSESQPAHAIRSVCTSARDCSCPGAGSLCRRNWGGCIRARVKGDSLVRSNPCTGGKPVPDSLQADTAGLQHLRLERQALVHPVVALEDLLAVEAGEAL